MPLVARFTVIPGTDEGFTLPDPNTFREIGFELPSEFDRGSHAVLYFRVNLIGQSEATLKMHLRNTDKFI